MRPKVKKRIGNPRKLAFLEDFKNQVEERNAQIDRETEEMCAKLIESYAAAKERISTLDIANMKIVDVLKMVPEPDVAEKENVVNVKVEQGSVVRGKSTGTAIGKKEIPALTTTVLRPPKAPAVAMQNLFTPAPVMNAVPSRMFPKLITPKVAGIGGSVMDTQTRPVRVGEVAFSAAGSPVVANAPVTEMMRDLIEGDETELTPETRKLAATMKQLLRKKMNVPSEQDRLEMEID